MQTLPATLHVTPELITSARITPSAIGMVTATASSTLSPDEADARPRSTADISALCQRIAARQIELIRNSDWTNPAWAMLVADNFKTYVPSAFLEELGHPSTDTRAAYLASYASFKLAHPEYDIVPTSMDADVDESRTSVRVWIMLEVFGHPPPLVKESVSIVHFALTKDGWRAVKQVGLRGPQGI